MSWPIALMRSICRPIILDLIKKETGISPQEYIQTKVIDIAKEKIFDLDKPISEIAYD
jgi:AraC-like DNA-binding protein